MYIEELITHFQGVKRLSGNNHYAARCPCHDDHKPSLDIVEKDGKILMACPVCGADGRKVMNELGLPVRELFTEQRSNYSGCSAVKKTKQSNTKKENEPLDFDAVKEDSEAVYEYSPDLVKFRMPGKKMMWAHREGSKWFWKRGDITPPLYKQNLLETARQNGSFVYIVEGEKDCNTLCGALNCIAVSAPDSAGKNKWLPEYNKLFDDIDVVIIPDNDTIGHEFSELIAAQINPHARSIKVLDLTNEWSSLKPKGDITDVYENETPYSGKTIAETVAFRLQALTERTAAYVPPVQEEEAAPYYPIWTYGDGDSRKLNEQLYITDFIEQKEVRCINGKLYSVNGAVEDGAARQMIIRDILPYVKSNHGDKAEKLLRGIKALCYTEPPKPDTERLHFANSTLSKDENGLFTVFSEEKDFCLNRFPVNYNPDATRPELFLRYLNDVYQGDDQITIQQYCGYCLMPTTILQKALIIIGEGGEGKSVLGAILNGVLGKDNCYNESLSVLQTTFGVANVEGKLLFIDDDLSESALTNARMFKNLVTNKTTISAQKKFVQDNQILSFVRFVCFGNFTLQALYDLSEGFQRRQLILQAKPKEPDRVDDPFIDREILDNETEGVIMWLLEGLNALIQNNWQITVSERTKEKSDSFKRENDSVLLFLTECGGIHIGEGLRAHSSTLYVAYERFCRDNMLLPLKERTFLSMMKSKGRSLGIAKLDYPFELLRCTGKRKARGFEGISVSDSYIDVNF